MKRLKLSSGIALAAFVFLTLASLFNAPTTLAAPEKLKLYLNWKAEPEFGGFYEAKRQGFFEKQGFDVELIEGGAGTPVIQMVASGAAEFGIAAADEVILSQDRGTDVVALFAVHQTSPQGILVHAERGFKNLAEVIHSEGTLSMQLGAGFTLFLQKKYAGEFKAKLVPYAGGIGPFLADPKLSQQCYVTAEPLAAERKGAKVQAFLIAESGFNPYNTVVVAKRSTVGKDPARAKRFLTAIREGWKAYLRDPNATHALMQKLNPSMDEETFAAIAKKEAPFILTPETKKHGLGTMTAARWEALSSQLREIGMTKKSHSGAALFIEP